MSSFIVSKQTIDATVWMLASMSPHTPTGIPSIDLARSLPPDGEGREDALTALGRRLYVMNAEAFARRYDGAVDTKPAESYRFEAPPISIRIRNTREMSARAGTVLYAAGSCLRYQCAEGNIPETKFYKALDRELGRFAEQVVSRTDAYREAHWG